MSYRPINRGFWISLCLLVLLILLAFGALFGSCQAMEAAHAREYQKSLDQEKRVRVQQACAAQMGKCMSYCGEHAMSFQCADDGTFKCEYP